MNDLRSSLNSEEMLQNFLYLCKKKTQVVLYIFHFEQLLFLPYLFCVSFQATFIFTL